jgi:pyruvate/2-oxoglutarate dehydrogenase complex dihydrolipoamide dehydrogenase (E3) component
MKVLISEGITFHLNSETQSAKDLGSEKEVIIKNGEGQILSLRGDTILVAVGRKANLAGLGLEGISVEFERKGLKVDSRLRTNHKHIYAAGDTTGSYLFTHAAGYEGGVVLSNSILHLPRKVDYTYLPWCTYADPELASIGMNEKRASAAGIPYSVWTEEFKANDRSLAEGEEVGMVKMLLDEREKPIGVQILGPRAGDLLSEWVSIMNGNVKLSTVASSVHPYPTLGEINKKVVGSFFSGKIFSEKVKRTLTFFFNLKGRACG